MSFFDFQTWLRPESNMRTGNFEEAIKSPRINDHVWQRNINEGGELCLSEEFRSTVARFRRHPCEHQPWKNQTKRRTHKRTERNKNQVDVLFKGIRSAAEMHKNLRYFPPDFFFDAFSGSDNVHSSSDGSRFLIRFVEFHLSAWTSFHPRFPFQLHLLMV